MTVAQTFRNQYTDMITLLSQQEKTIFEQYVTMDEFTDSEFKFHDTIDSITMTQRSDLGFEAISLTDVTHNIRSYTYGDFQVALKLSKNQMRRTNLKFEPYYIEDVLAAWNRVKETTILASLTATVQAGKDRATAVNFNYATNVIGPRYQLGDALNGNEATGSAVNRTGMTADKIVAAATLLRARYALGNTTKLVLAIGPEELLDLMNDTKFTSRDFRPSEAPVGTIAANTQYIATYFNTDIIMSTNLTIRNPAGATNDYRQCPMWVPSQIMYYADSTPEIQVEKATGFKGFPYILDASGSVGAMRRKDDAVVIIGSKNGALE